VLPRTRFPTAPTPVGLLSERRTKNWSNDVANLCGLIGERDRNIAGIERVSHPRFAQDGGIRRQFASRLEIELTLAALRFYTPILADPTCQGTFDTVGYAFLAGPQNATYLAQAWQLQREMGLPVEWLDRPQLAERFPYREMGDLVGHLHVRCTGQTPRTLRQGANSSTPPFARTATRQRSAIWRPLSIVGTTCE